MNITVNLYYGVETVDPFWGPWLLCLSSSNYLNTDTCAVHFSSVTLSCLTVNPWTAAHQASLSITNSQSLPKLMSVELVMASNHILCRSVLLLPSIFPNIRVFSSESALRIKCPKHCSFSFNISSSNEHPGLIFRQDGLDLLVEQASLKSLLQHHSSKTSILGAQLFLQSNSHIHT